MKLTKLANNRYRFSEDHVQIEGDWDCIHRHMITNCQISRDEISMALSWMGQTNHNTAHFGLLGRVTHTSNEAFVAGCIRELESILRAQKRFHQAYTRDRSSRETHNAADDLKLLWVALNVDGIKALLEDKYEVRQFKQAR